MLFNKVVKFGKKVRLSEAWALQLVAEKTSVPVPKVYSVFMEGGIKYLVMERIKGIAMNEVWKEIPKEDHQHIVGQLKGYSEQLRQIPYPRPGTICSAAADDYTIFQYRTPNTVEGAGPFQSEEDFNLFLRSGPPWSAEYGKKNKTRDLNTFIQMQSASHEICFTRGDAAPRNIMVQKSRSGYHVSGLIDFEMSGFLPEYWEYVTARVPFRYWGPSYWNAEVDKFLTPYPTELEQEQRRLSYFGGYGA